MSGRPDKRLRADPSVRAYKSTAVMSPDGLNTRGGSPLALLDLDLREAQITAPPLQDHPDTPHAEDMAERFTVEIEREEDGRWIAEISELPGVMAYGMSREDAVAKVEALALRVLAERLEQGETDPEPFQVAFVVA